MGVSTVRGRGWAPCSVPAMAQRLAVVGGDAAGMSAASAARRRDDALDIVAFERGPYTSYSACGIPFYVSGVVERAEALIARSPDEHRANGIAVHTRTEVTALDLARRELTVRDQAGAERSEGFDLLVLATGAEAVAPPVPGADAAEPARTVDAAERLRHALERGGDRAVVVGGGYIGLEMAEALVQRGLRVTLVERDRQVMATLDPDMAAHVQDAAEGVGIEVRLGADLQEVRDDVVVVDGDELAADQVLIATGVRPAVGLAEAAGLEVGETGALVVDDHQRCPGHDGVFAAGDCVESWHRVLRRPVNVQLGTHANKQGRIAGANLTGSDLAFPGVIGTAASKLCRHEVSRTGLDEREAGAAGIEARAVTIESTTRAAYYPGAGPIWVKLVVAPGDGRLLGAQIVGVEGAAKRIDVLAMAVWTGMGVDELALVDLAYAPPYSGVYDPVLIAASAALKLL
jgi:NADPH-dependent 2,4-dienoyl-CoA reductase/sulfur reductase-like enzyme